MTTLSRRAALGATLAAAAGVPLVLPPVADQRLIEIGREVEALHHQRAPLDDEWWEGCRRTREGVKDIDGPEHLMARMAPITDRIDALAEEARMLVPTTFEGVVARARCLMDWYSCAYQSVDGWDLTYANYADRRAFELCRQLLGMETVSA